VEMWKSSNPDFHIPTTHPFQSSLTWESRFIEGAKPLD